jgi:hypothetical protein
LHNLIPVLPQAERGETAAAQQDNHHDDNDDSVVVFFGFDGHLVVHDFYSCGINLIG